MNYVVTWGKDHKKSFNKEKQARDFAYQKAFYFAVSINGVVFERSF